MAEIKRSSSTTQAVASSSAAPVQTIGSVSSDPQNLHDVASSIPFGPSVAKPRTRLVVPEASAALSTHQVEQLHRMKSRLESAGTHVVAMSETELLGQPEAVQRALRAIHEAVQSREPYTSDEVKELVYEQLRDATGAVDYTSPAIPLLRDIADVIFSQQAWRAGASRAGEGVVDFALGILDGVQPNPNAPRTRAYFGHNLEHASGQVLGATIGLVADTAGFAFGLASLLATPPLALVSGGLTTAPTAAVSAALVGAAALSGRAHAQHLGDALQAYAHEAASETAGVRGPHRHPPRIEDGNSRQGWQHIDERHLSGTNPGGHLFPPGTTREELQSVAKQVVKKGARRTDEPTGAVQVFEKRVRVNGVWCDVKVVVQSLDRNRVITMFPVGRDCK